MHRRRQVVQDEIREVVGLDGGLAGAQHDGLADLLDPNCVGLGCLRLCAQRHHSLTLI
jgi:hypothetical protein